ncbi:MAG: hypothetical protein WDZ40_03580 [Candidatus Spechtbacterales bacterium]
MSEKYVENPSNLNKFDLVQSGRIELGVIVSDPFSVSWHEHGPIGDPSSYALVNDNMVVVWLPLESRTELCRIDNLNLLSVDIEDLKQRFSDLVSDALLDAHRLRAAADAIGEKKA